MKAGREHRVPLSPEALELLQQQPRFVPADGQPDLLFPGRSGKPLSDMSLTAVLRRLEVEAVPHGFRSTFADWRAEKTTYPHELAEMALAHTLGDKTRESYQRTDMMERRRQMMQDWARYCTTVTTLANVFSIKNAA
jgi:integrase